MKHRWIAVTALLALSLGCGEAGEVQWGPWQSYPDEDSTGEMVEGEDHWEHRPTFFADAPRQYRYTTSHSVDAFVAPADGCSRASADETWSGVTEFDVGDYGDDVSGDSGEPICVRIETDLLTPDAMWHVEPKYRQKS